MLPNVQIYQEILITTSQTNQPYSSPAWFQLPEAHSRSNTVLIIGTGIAGCSTAYSLAQRGWKVMLIDRNDSIAQEGSGNRQGALYAKLPVQPIPASQIHLAGFLYSSNFLTRELPDDRNIWSPCGLLQIAANDKEQQKQVDLVASGNYPRSLVQHLSQAEASQVAGTSVTNSGLFFPDAGWVTPPLLCQWLNQHPNITLKLSQEVTQLEYDAVRKQWSALSDQSIIGKASVAVVASAADSARFVQLNHLPLQKIRGQVSIAKTDDTTTKLNTVLCSEGYISPAKEDRFCFGATFDLKDEGTDIRPDGHSHNIGKIADMAPDLAVSITQSTPVDQFHGRVAFRCASPDKLPIVGPAPVFDAFCEDYAKLRNDRTIKIETPPQHYPGLYVNLAHGSKGLITGPISGEIIAAMLENETLPIANELIDKLNPARFIIKNLIRRAI
ncbi:FAD-dependent 5-carboxymethylaminomethyl-2-thiouridine(34) oxidoreductase MnmC [Amphritea sp. HPY]|uniref:FAD-dependent 5-carboxymethylaminomethyl-2-thiouridine(34) oxidoreductase MnmC n=1 Tax=Amphritea sp. HPY TaxID=3421652 RepID=UPI003D7CCEFD